MATKIGEYTKFFMNFKYKKQLIIAIGIIGVMLIVLSEFISIPSSQKIDENEIDYQEYISMLESKTQDIISSINGVGKCKVMITLEQTNENIFAKNTDESNQNGHNSKKSEYVLYENENNDEPILIKQYFPKVYGVVVVCQGGDDNATKEAVISSISSLYDIPYSKISVSKLKSNG